MKIHKQGGLSLVGFIFVLILGLCIAFLGMKIGPLYLEYSSLVRVMNDIASQQGSGKLSPYDIRLKVIAGLEMNYSNNIKESHIKITKSNGINLRVAYEVREPIVGNLDVITKFDKTVHLTR